MKFVTNFTIQLCPSFVNCVAQCNRCFQTQVLKKITFSCVMRISCVGFIVTQIQHLELCSTTRKRNIFKKLPYSLLGEMRSTYWKQNEWLFAFLNQLNSQCFDQLELVKLSRIIGYINTQVGNSILSCLAHRIRLLILKKLTKIHPLAHTVD